MPAADGFAGGKIRLFFLKAPKIDDQLIAADLQPINGSKAHFSFSEKENFLKFLGSNSESSNYMLGKASSKTMNYQIARISWRFCKVRAL